MINLLRIGNVYYAPNRKEFLIDSVEDLDSLPTSTTPGDTPQTNTVCAPGSIAYTADMGTIFMLGNDDEWHSVSTGA